MNNIRPSADLRNRYNEISQICKDSGQPIYITVNGRGDSVILSLSQYNSMQEELELLKDLAESEQDVSLGKVFALDDVFNGIKKRLTNEA